MGRDLDFSEDYDAHHDEGYDQQLDEEQYDDDVNDDYDEEFWEDDLRPSARERWLKIALLAIAAGLAATIVSLISQRSDDDADVSTERSQATDTPAAEDSADGDGASATTTPSTAAPAVSSDESTADSTATGVQPAVPAAAGDGPRSGTVTIDIDARTDTGGRAVDIVNRFNGADYATTIAFIDDPDTYSGSAEIEELRYVDGAYYHRATVDGEWQPAADPSVVSLDEGIALPPSVIGSTTAGIDELIAAAGITPAADGQAATGTITVGQARSLATPPAAIAIIVGDEWDWGDDQTITVNVTFVDGRVSELGVEASDDDTNRPSGPVTVTALTSFTELDAGPPIEIPS